ncbi:MAG: (Fe-S)-binding protein [Candidatus Eremiobacteraeota bacterium]|nr:(Fe-S)-binding protein [Candidatus Eremiobacteraeota bacterium]
MADRGYIGEQHPQLSALDRCTRCGLCEQACPTYRLEHYEPDSPRGRIFLMKEVAEGRSAVDANFAEHLYRCLGCRACETACPSSVPFGELLEDGRYQVELHGELDPKRRGWRTFRHLAFETVLPSRTLFTIAMLPAQIVQQLPPLRALRFLFPRRSLLRKALSMIPSASTAGGVVKAGTVIEAEGTRRARVGLFTGCVMDALFAGVHAATARVLARNGCDVVVPSGQWCCGALNVHAGERRHATEMARVNLAAFADPTLDAIVVNSAGCGAMLKGYASLLDGDAQAQRFGERVKDASEFLFELGLRQGLGPVYERATYQDACHLAHGQGIRQAPRALLVQIPGLKFVELPNADRCCGAAGVYNLTQPDRSAAILEEKVRDIEATGAQSVVTTNPGCAMQLQAGLAERRLQTRVCHLIEMLDRSYRSGP